MYHPGSILDIFGAVDAELWSEGYPAMHGITLREVASYVRMLQAAGIVTVERRKS